MEIIIIVISFAAIVSLAIVGLKAKKYPSTDKRGGSNEDEENRKGNKPNEDVDTEEPASN